MPSGQSIKSKNKKREKEMRKSIFLVIKSAMPVYLLKDDILHIKAVSERNFHKKKVVLRDNFSFKSKTEIDDRF